MSSHGFASHLEVELKPSPRLEMVGGAIMGITSLLVLTSGLPADIKGFLILWATFSLRSQRLRMAATDGLRFTAGKGWFLHDPLAGWQPAECLESRFFANLGLYLRFRTAAGQAPGLWLDHYSVGHRQETALRILAAWPMTAASGTWHNRTRHPEMT